jgi:hypothetical protein
MNRCDISEDETTEALNALFVIPATARTFSSGSPQIAGTGTATSSAYNISGQFERSRKRKNAPSNGKDLDESSYHTPSLTPSMSNQQDPIRDERTTDDTRYSSERDSVSKHGPRPVSKSADLISEKLKPKYKNHSSYSDEGSFLFFLFSLCMICLIHIPSNKFSFCVVLRYPNFLLTHNFIVYAQEVLWKRPRLIPR